MSEADSVFSRQAGRINPSHLCLSVHGLLHLAKVLLELVKGVLGLLRILDKEEVLLFQRLCMHHRPIGQKRGGYMNIVY